ncbi:MAG: phosphatidylglycerol lysyltransferase domain-containing protein [Acidothermus sp.]|nr:phosphatidylglycerol lysyltransferase domain-containing protein [Acidothermus sp.]
MRRSTPVSSPPRRAETVIAAPEAGERRPRRSRGTDRPLLRRLVPRLAGWITLLLGVRTIILVIRPQWWEHVSGVGRVLPTPPGGPVLHGAAAATAIVSGALLMLVAHALYRRKRRAWQVATTVLALGIALHLVHFLHHPAARGVPGWIVVDGAFLAGLLVFRREFLAEPDPRSRWAAPLAFVGLGTFSVVVGLLLLLVRQHQIVGKPSVLDLLRHVLYGLIGIPGPLSFRSDGTGDLVAASLAGLGALTLVATAYLTFRPAEPQPALTEEDERRMRALLAVHGRRDSLGYFALRRDKSVVWSPSGKSCIAYRVVSGVMLASGDPLGDPEAWPGAIRVFLAEAERHAWVPAVLGCSERAGEVWVREGGLSALEIGDEAVVHVDDFSLDGRAMRNVRQMVNRVRRLGYHAVLYRSADLPPDLREHIVAAACEWRDGDTERGFAMALGRLADPADPDCLFVVALRDGQPRAFLHFVPWGPDGLSLDVMRRAPNGPPGVNEFLITELLAACPRLGIHRISLNFAVFRSALERGDRLGAGPILRSWRAILLFASRWVQIESLYRFNAKFHPEWVPRYLVFPDMLDVPRIALAALEAEAFIVWPRPRIRQLRRLLRMGVRP